MSGQITSFTDTIAKSGKYAPAAGRYLLYASYGCPFAMRAVMARAVKGLEEVIQLCIVDYHYTDNGLAFNPAVSGCHPDPIMNAKYLKELYLKACPHYEGAFSVPILWDKQTSTIVNNESEDIMRMFNSAFNDFAKNPSLDLYPEALRDEIDKCNGHSADVLQTKAKAAGRATAQAEYDTNVKIVKDYLLSLDDQLGKSKFLFGDMLTEADLRLFIVLLRHDTINVLLHRVNNVFVRDLKNVMRYISDILGLPHVGNCVHLDHIVGLAFSKKAFNPSGIIPAGLGFVLPCKL